MKIEIYYMVAAGNFFTIIDNRLRNFDIEFGQKLAPIVCKEENGFKTDGLILLNAGDEEFDFRCDYFNPDGTTGMMCGNGARCISRFANIMIGFNKKKIKFEMANNTYFAEFKTSNIKIKFPPVEEISDLKKITVNKENYNFNYVNLSTDHCVIKVENLSQLDVNQVGSLIRNDSAFAPNGVNVNFYDIQDNKVYLRTFERGVENETGSCGTGAIATALVANMNENLEFPIRLTPSSNSDLIVDISLENPLEPISVENIKNVYLEGNATILDKKVTEINL